MAKTMKLAALAAALLAAGPLFAQDGGIKDRAAAAVAKAKAQGQLPGQPQGQPTGQPQGQGPGQQVSTAPYSRPGLGDDKQGKGPEQPAVKRKPIRELAPSMAPAEDMGKTVTTLKVLDGTADGKSVHKFKIPKGVHWRVLWEFKATTTDPEKHGKLTLRVDSPKYKDFHQELVKEVNLYEDPYGMINVCERGEGDFNLTIDSLSTQWHVEVQQLK